MKKIWTFLGLRMTCERVDQTGRISARAGRRPLHTTLVFEPSEYFDPSKLCFFIDKCVDKYALGCAWALLLRRLDCSSFLDLFNVPLDLEHASITTTLGRYDCAPSIRLYLIPFLI